MSYVLGLDLGTSSLKAVLVTKNGHLIAEHAVAYPLITPAFGYFEQDPKEWLNACDVIFENFKKTVSDFLDKLEGISFSGQMHSLVILDQEQKSLRNAILWNDTRTSQQCQRIREQFGQEMMTITKNKVLEGFTLPKILWLQENEPENWAKTSFIQLPKDYLRLYLSGKINMDYSDAAGTLLLDIEKKKWSEAILKQFKIPSSILPDLIASKDCVGGLREEIKKKYGFDHDVKVYAGGADNACAAIGAGLLSEDTALCSIGTSGVLLSLARASRGDVKDSLHFFNHAIENLNYRMGVTLAAGNSFSWFRDTFSPSSDFSQLLEAMSTVPGAEGLLFSPYILGERSPHADSHIRASFIGIDRHHRLEHFTRAVVEGITFSLKDNLLLMEKMRSKPFTSIIAVGGAAKSSYWLQMQADIFNCKLVTLKSEQGPSLGAAMIAAVGAGWFQTFQEAIDTFVHYSDIFYPVKERVQLYQSVYQKFCKIYAMTKAIMD